MANKVKRISINALEKATKENYSPTATVEWCGLGVVIKRNLTLSEMRIFVDSVVKACFSEPVGVYMPELKDYAIRAMAIELYTNLSTPSDLHKKYDLLYSSDIWYIVLSNIDQDQFNEMLAAIDEKIRNIASANVSLINKQVSDLYSSIENIQAQLSSLFDGIGADDVRNLVGAIANGGIDEEKLIKAYMANREDDGKDKENIG